MGSQTTKPYRNTLSGSIGAGMGSLFAPGGKKYYILEHRVTSKYHRAGESQEIIVDNIELGRDPHCQVRFDESFKTVSRHHAAIVRDGDMWKLVQISKTNTTFLNGHPVRTEWYLQNGDEIQLSVNGPKLGFIVPTGKKSTVGSIGLTRRLSLFRQQALRPYKTAITVVSCFLVLAVGGGAFALKSQHGEIGRLTAKLKDNSEALEAAKIANAALWDTIAARERANAAYLAEKEKELEALRKKQEATARELAKISSSGGANIDMSSCHPYVFYIKAIPFIDGKQQNWSWGGTGFQLNDGMFVTARHVVSPYYSNGYRIVDGEVVLAPGADPMAVYIELILNIAFQGGRAEILFECISPNKNFKFTSKQVAQLEDYDRIHTLQEPYQVKTKDENGKVIVVCEIPAGMKIREGGGGCIDFAFCQNNINEGLSANRSLSEKLVQGTQLYILGYPNHWGQGNPILSTAICSQNGLSEDLGNTIMASNNNTEGGNSGGPVFVKNGNDWEVVAIVSGRNNQKGRFVPIVMIPE